MRTEAPTCPPATHRIKSRRGHASATIATAHQILTAAYHVLQRGVPYHELGEGFFYRDTEATERYRRRLIKQLGRLGHQVTTSSEISTTSAALLGQLALREQSRMR